MGPFSVFTLLIGFSFQFWCGNWVFSFSTHTKIGNFIIIIIIITFRQCEVCSVEQTGIRTGISS